VEQKVELLREWDSFCRTDDASMDLNDAGPSFLRRAFPTSRARMQDARSYQSI
jgi:hypothetical protein